MRQNISEDCGCGEVPTVASASPPRIGTDAELQLGDHTGPWACVETPQALTSPIIRYSDKDEGLSIQQRLEQIEFSDDEEELELLDSHRAPGMRHIISEEELELLDSHRDH